MMDNQESSKASAVAGASAGTLLVLLANNLPDDSIYKTWLVILAPTMSIIFSNFGDWLKKRMSKGRALKDAESASNMIDQFMQDPDATSEHLASLRSEKESLQKTMIKIAKKDIYDELNSG